MHPLDRTLYVQIGKGQQGSVWLIYTLQWNKDTPGVVTTTGEANQFFFFSIQ